MKVVIGLDITMQKCYKIFNKTIKSLEIKRKRSEISGVMPCWRLHFLRFIKTMKDLEAQLDLLATQLAELMLSQLGYRFIPKVGFVTGGTFTVFIGFQFEQYGNIPFSYTSLKCEVVKEFYEYQ